MPRRTNQHVILSHGGKHGVQAKTLLKGQVVSAPAAAHVPARMIDSAPGPGKHDTLPDGAQKAAPAVVQMSAKAMLGETVFAAIADEATYMGSEAPPETSSSSTDSEPETVEDVAGEASPAPATPTPAEVSVPTSKRALKRLSKSDAYALARELALNVPDDIDAIKLTEMQRKLAAELGL